MCLTILTFSLFRWRTFLGSNSPSFFWSHTAYTWLFSCILDGWTNVSGNIVVIGHWFGVVPVEIRVSDMRIVGL